MAITGSEKKPTRTLKRYICNKNTKQHLNGEHRRLVTRNQLALIKMLLNVCIPLPTINLSIFHAYPILLKSN